MNLTEAKELALKLLQEWECYGWTFKWTNGKRQLGAAVWRMRRWSREVYSTELHLSRNLVIMNNISEVEDTIRHEIAHIKAGHAAGHGPLWQIWAVRIGAKPERCNTTAAMPTHKWKNVCLNCGQTTRLLHRRTDVSNRHSVCCKSKIQTVANVAA